MIKRLKQILALRKFQKKWRTLNPHNRTTAQNVFTAERVTVGNYSYGGLTIIHNNYYPNEGLQIGHFCSIAVGVRFYLAGMHKIYRPTTYPIMRYFYKEGRGKDGCSKGPIVIGDDVWIGANATILSGITVGQGAVIGGASVVASSVPPYAIVAGNPARIIKYRFDPEKIELLKQIDFAKITDHVIKENRQFFLNENLSIEDIKRFLARI